MKDDAKRERDIQEIVDMLCDLDDRHVAEVKELVTDAVATRIARREYNRDQDSPPRKPSANR
jgi:hypothetical protein